MEGFLIPTSEDLRFSPTLEGNEGRQNRKGTPSCDSSALGPFSPQL